MESVTYPKGWYEAPDEVIYTCIECKKSCEDCQCICPTCPEKTLWVMCGHGEQAALNAFLHGDY